MTAVTVTSSPAGRSIVVDGSTYIAPQTFQWMPGSNHTIGVVSPQGTGGVRHTFTGWSDGGVQTHTITTPSAAATYTAAFQTAYLVTTGVSPASSGTVQVSPSSPDGYYRSGTSVQLTASPAAGYLFSGWSGGITGSSSPAGLLVTAPAAVTASFGRAPQSISVITSPAGLSVVVDGSTYTAPQTFSWTPGSSHTIGVVSPQGPAGVRHTFSSWSDGGAQTHSITTPSSAATYTATFQTAYLLTTAVSPAGSGAVQVSPPSPDGYYLKGSSVQLTAVAGAGYQWSSWTGGGLGAPNPLTTAVTAAHTIGANFTPSPQGITITTNPPGLEIVVDGVSLVSPQTFQWTPGSSHTMGVASPQGSGGRRYTFTGWSDGGGQSHSITTPSSSTIYTASFQAAYLLTAAAVPAGAGSVQVSPPSADGYYAHGTAVQLTATPASGYRFTAWSGGASGPASPVVFAMTGPATVSGAFTAVSSGITITTNPPGLGLVIDGVPATAPHSFQWTAGSSHTIGAVAPPAAGGTRHVFSRWSDGGAQTHAITVPETNTVYTADFLAQHLLTVSANPSGAGLVQITPSSADGYYNNGVVVQLTAAAGGGFRFVNWGGDLSGEVSPAAIAVNGPRTVSGVFAAAAQCGFTLSRGSYAAPSEGDMGRVDVRTSPNCVWSASTSTPWISLLSGFSGSGNGTLRFSVAANASAAMRTGTITIAGQTVPVGQASIGCGLVFGVQNGNTAAVPQAGTALQLMVTTVPDCAWPVSPAPGWLTLVANDGGAGSGVLRLAAGSNPDPLPRTGSVSLGGMVSHFVQAPAVESQAFSDVPAGHPFLHHINLLRTQGVTSGCTGSLFCPEAPTTRGQMAVFIVRSLFGGDTFPFPDTPFFTDVPAGHPYFRHIQKMREVGVTAGCSATQYCPDDPVTRGQMAVFLVRARLGIGAGQSLPHPPSLFFQDVAASHPYFAFIQKMRQLGITAGCSATEYCSDRTTTRGQMAVFLIRAFFTP